MLGRRVAKKRSVSCYNRKAVKRHSLSFYLDKLKKPSN